MNVFYRLRVIAWLVTALMLDPGPALFAKNKSGEKLYKQGQQAEQHKEYDLALQYYDEALATNPSDPAFNVGSRRMHVKVGQIHLETAKKLREAGNLHEALVEFQKAFAFDPSNTLALQEMQET